MYTKYKYQKSKKYIKDNSIELVSYIFIGYINQCYKKKANMKNLNNTRNIFLLVTSEFKKENNNLTVGSLNVCNGKLFWRMQFR